MISIEHRAMDIFTKISQKRGPELAKAVSDNKENIQTLKDKNGTTVLHYAAADKRIHILTSILELGINANITDDNGCTPLFYAAAAGKVEAITALIRHGASVNHKNSAGQTPITLAAGEGHLEAVKTLINNNADINLIEAPHQSALSFACLRNHPEIVKFLIEEGAEYNLNEIIKLVINTTYHIKVVEVLIEQDDYSAKEMLQHAISYRHDELTKFLISKISEPDIDPHGFVIDIGPNRFVSYDNILFLAANKGFINVTNYLLKRGADVNKTDAHNETVLFYALKPEPHSGIPKLPDNSTMEENKTKITAALLKYGANVNHTDNYDFNTPLQIATFTSSIERVKLLLKYSANVNYGNNKYKTPLDIAANNKHAGIAKLLIEHGATADISKSTIACSLQDHIKAQKWCNGSNIATGISEQTKNIIKTIITNKLAQNPSILDDSLTDRLEDLGINTKEIYDQCVTNSIENAVDGLWNPFYNTLLVISAITLKQQEETKQSDVQDITEISTTSHEADILVTGSASEAPEEHC